MYLIHKFWTQSGEHEYKLYSNYDTAIADFREILKDIINDENKYLWENDKIVYDTRIKCFDNDDLYYSIQHNNWYIYCGEVVEVRMEFLDINN